LHLWRYVVSMARRLLPDADHALGDLFDREELRWRL
jgi:hypothetical protein